MTRAPTQDEKSVRPDCRSLRDVIQEAGKLLPMPGPISAFAFLNTLEALEDLPFDEGMRKGARLYGCEPYLTEDQYRDRWAQGRIRNEDVAAVLCEELGERADAQICSLGTKFELRMAMLQYRLRFGPPAELRWFVAETDALERVRDDISPLLRKRFIDETKHWVMRDLRDGHKHAGHGSKSSPRHPRQNLLAELSDRFHEASIEDWSDQTWQAFAMQALWRVCRDGAEGVAPAAAKPLAPSRHRDLLRDACGEDSDLLVNQVLIRFCAAFTDQGFAVWSLPRREQGMYKSFFDLYGKPSGRPDRWLLGLVDELARLEKENTGPLESILESLEMLGVSEDEWQDFIPATFLALKGWAGMIRHMEVRADRVPFPVPAGSMCELLAIRLILERQALAHIARRNLKYRGKLAGLRAACRSAAPKPQATSSEQRAFLVFQIAQIMGWYPHKLRQLSRQQWSTLLVEIKSFSSLERRRILHLALERRFRIQALDAFALRATRDAQRVESPRFQIAFCLDTREESFRRHLEEVAPDTETFGAAGFYGVAMYYRGASDAHFAALCPVVIKPQHWVVEDVVYSLEETHRQRAKTRRALGTATHQVHVGSRSLASGALLSASLGVLASIPLVARVLFPRLTAHVRRTAGGFLQSPPVTRLRLERAGPTPGPGENDIGYSVEEMADIGERMLRDIGLTYNFSRLMIFLGHGSFCLNNPHKSAYDCGACSGSPGGSNGRALAVILNDVRVREILANRGLQIPSDTLFLGGLHNTTVDAITFSDLDLLPKSHIPDFEAARDVLAETCNRNAHERCRRFESAPLDLTPEAAHRHVEDRSEDLAQMRPEYGNATNAICFVGRRERTRGLYLDRRCFLASYDPAQDDADCTILGRILAAAVPVCEGINMQYNLSYIDSPGWACGTKLPHNVTSLLGVMDGAASDLRPGLPWQGVDIHEPMRLLFIIEASPEGMRKTMDRNEVIGRILRNGWAQLALLDPNSAEILVFRNDEFQPYQPESKELPSVASSVDWYRGWRDHLGFAFIDPPAPIDVETGAT